MRRDVWAVTQKPRRIDLSADNFIAGIAGQMSAEQLGLYWLICLLIYSNGGPVDYDEHRFAALLPGTHWRSIRAASQRLQDLGKITVCDGQVMAKGCSEPLHAAFMRVSKAAENGVKGGRPRKENNDLVKPDGFHEEKLTRVTPPSPSQPPSPPEDLLSAGADPLPPSKPRSERRTYPEAFEAFWRDYPTDPNMSKKAAAEKWSRLSPEDREAARAAVPAFRAYCSANPTYRPVHAERFLSQRRFDGFLDAGRNTTGADLPAPPDWGDAGHKLIEVIGAPAFAQWFGGGAVELVAGSPVRLVVDKQFRRNWIARNYQGALAQAFGADVVIECANDTTSDRRAIR